MRSWKGSGTWAIVEQDHWPWWVFMAMWKIHTSHVSKRCPTSHQSRWMDLAQQPQPGRCFSLSKNSFPRKHVWNRASRANSCMQAANVSSSKPKLLSYHLPALTFHSKNDKLSESSKIPPLNLQSVNRYSIDVFLNCIKLLQAAGSHDLLFQ